MEEVIEFENTGIKETEQPNSQLFCFVFILRIDFGNNSGILT